MKPLVLFLAVIMISSQLDAAPVEWKLEDGGNGHFYEAFAPGPVSWTDASAAATSLGGYLATITSDAENDFIFSLIDSDGYWQEFTRGDGQLQTHGPWIGLLQTPGSIEPNGGWAWVSGELFAFSAWATDEPNGQNLEDFGQFFGGPADGSVRQPFWNDHRDEAVVPENGPIAYVVEFSAAPEPTNASLLLIALMSLTKPGRAGLGLRRR